MSSDSSLISTQPNGGRETNSKGVVPDAAFTIVLKVRMRPGLSSTDQKSILCEYGRKTCGEPGVIRCDIVYQVNSKGLAKGTFYEIWVFFEDSAAYIQHEKTAHAAKLRVFLENPHGGDSAVALTKLSYSSLILEPVLPHAEGWKSRIDYEVEEQDERDRRVADAAMGMLRSEKSFAGGVSDTYRKSLEVLLSNVGLENVIVLVAVATAKSSQVLASLIGICEEFVENEDRVLSTVRTGVFVAKNDPQTVVVVTVHDAESNDGAFFDSDLAVDFVDENGWTIKRYFSVFPDKIGWERREKVSADLNPEPQSFLGPIEELVQSSGLARATTSSSSCRLVYGAGSFDRLKLLIREMTGIFTGNIKAMLVFGWNASRSTPLLTQLEYMKDKDPPGEIFLRQGLAILSCMPRVQRVRQGMSFIRDHQPDVIIAYGGGSVLEIGKIIGRLGWASEKEVEDCITKLNEGASNDIGRVKIMPRSRAIPVLLLPICVTAGGELADMCIVQAEAGDGRSRRLAIDFEDPPNLVRSHNERVVVVDSRLLRPRRFVGPRAAQGALMLVCRAIETLIAMYEIPNHEAIEQAEKALKDAYEAILPALREPENSTGASRDPLATAKTQVGLAADCAGRLGICSRITLAIIDELLEGAQPYCFQMIIARVTIALLGELDTWLVTDAERIIFAVTSATDFRDGSQFVQSLLERAEDVGVLTLPEMGLVRRKVPAIVSYVHKTILEEPVSTLLEQRIAEPEVLKRILCSALNQDYEL